MKHSYQPKPLFVERMKELLGKANYGRYKIAIETEPLRSIRVNTLKISVSELKNRLEKKSWVVKQPFKENPEIFVIEGKYVDKNENNIDDGTKTNFDNRVNSVKNISVKSLAKPTLSHQSASEGGHRPSVVDGERNSLYKFSADKTLLSYFFNNLPITTQIKKIPAVNKKLFMSDKS